MSAAVVGRTLRGVPGDVLWRFEEGRSVKKAQRAASGEDGVVRAAWATVTQAWFTPLAVLLGVFNVVAAVWIAAFDPDVKMPGQLVGPMLLIAFAVSMFTGLWLRWRGSARPPAVRGPDARADARAEARSSTISAILVGLGIVAAGLIVLGLMSVPLPLVVGGALLIVVVLVAIRRRLARSRGAVPSTHTESSPDLRSRQSVVLADSLILIGTLPAIGLWWMVIPPLVAFAVIAGVLGTGRGAKAPRQRAIFR